MRNTYSPWEALADLPHIELRREIIGHGRLGEYVHHLGLIRLDPRMPRRQARSVLCHELVHVRFEDVPTACGFMNLRQEVRADTNAARLLIDIDDLAEALVLHDHHLSAAAVELRVSDKMVQVRLEHLHPSERHYLRRQVGEGLSL